jgi:hypothetical protein
MHDIYIYVYIYIHIYIYMYIYHIKICRKMDVNAFLCVYLYTYAYLDQQLEEGMHIHKCIYIYMYIIVNICLLKSTHICIYMYINIQKFRSAIRGGYASSGSQELSLSYYLLQSARKYGTKIILQVRTYVHICVCEYFRGIFVCISVLEYRILRFGSRYIPCIYMYIYKIYICMYTCFYTYIYIYILTYTHTYIYICRVHASLNYAAARTQQSSHLLENLVHEHFEGIIYI